MPATATFYPRHDAAADTHRLHHAAPAPIAVALPDAAGITHARLQARTSFIVESLAAIAIAVGGYLR